MNIRPCLILRKEYWAPEWLIADEENIYGDWDLDDEEDI